VEEKLSVEVLINKMDLLQHLETAKKSVTSRICLDDFFAIDDNEYTLLESELNELYPDFTFKVVPVFSGFALDLLITNKEAKKRYDAILKTKTYHDVYRFLYEKHGIHSSGSFTEDMSEKITDNEFDSLVNFHLSLSKMTKEAFKQQY
jgi:hypothetical protein